MTRSWDAGVAGGFLVLADGEEVAAEDRAVQHDAHDDGDDDEGDEGVRHAEAAAGGQPFERLEAAGIAEADGRVVHVVAGGTAVDQEAAEGDDEGLHVEARHQDAVDDAEADAEPDGDRQDELPGHAIVGHEVDEDHPDQREHRAHREVDAAGDDDHTDADREDAEEADEVRHVAEIDRRQEDRVEEGGDGTHDEDQHEEPEVFLLHGGNRFRVMRRLVGLRPGPVN
jgi:hypothetical protein